MSQDNQRKFWQLFVENNEMLRRLLLDGRTRGAFDRMESLFKKCGYDFAFDLTTVADKAVLTITPEGNSKVAEEIDSLILQCPELLNWIIHNRRQRKPLNDAFEILKSIYGEDARDALFSVTELNGKYEVIMYTHAVDGFTKSQAEGFVATFLEHALGEDIVMSRIAHIRGSSEFPNEGSHSSEEIVRILGQ